MRPEVSYHWKIPIIPSGIEPATCQFVAQCPKHHTTARSRKVQYNCTVYHTTSASHQFKQGIPQAITVKQHLSSKRYNHSFQITLFGNFPNYTSSVMKYFTCTLMCEGNLSGQYIFCFGTHGISCAARCAQCGPQTLGSLLYFFWLKFHLFSGPILRFTLQSLLTFIGDLCSSGIWCRVYW